jgi:hypothetical protein
LSLKDEFGTLYHLKSKKEFFDTESTDMCLLFVKRLNTIIAAIKTLNLQEIYDRSKDKKTLTDEIYLLNTDVVSVDRFLDDYNDRTSSYTSKHTIHYPPVVSEDYMGGSRSKRSKSKVSRSSSRSMSFTKSAAESKKLKHLKSIVFGPPQKWSFQKKMDVDLLTTVASVLRIKRIAENGRFFEQEEKGYYIKPKKDYRRFDKIDKVDNSITRRRSLKMTAGKRLV